MSDLASPSVITGLLAIHSAITRGLRVAVARSGTASQHGFTDAASSGGFIDYLNCLVQVLSAHHDTEDTLAFPVFRGMLDAPFDRLTEQHRVLHPLLEEAKSGITAAAAEPSTTVPWVELRRILENIEGLWHPHIGIEEEHFTVDRFASLIPPDEHRRLLGLFMEHMQKSTSPDYLIVPFLLYNSDPDGRSFFLREMPPVVTQQLVPVAWKEKWAPMRPFLLA